MVNTAKFYFVDCQPINIKEIIELEYHIFIAPNETRELGRDHKQPRAIFWKDGSGWKHLFTVINICNTERRQPDIVHQVYTAVGSTKPHR